MTYNKDSIIQDIDATIILKLCLQNVFIAQNECS